MALGLPVVSTLHVGIPELVEDGVSGFLVPERDVSSLADKVRWLAEHSEHWPDLGRAGRRKVVQDYDLTKLNDELAAIYRQLVDHDTGDTGPFQGRVAKSIPDTSVHRKSFQSSTGKAEPKVTIAVVPRERFSYTQQSLESVYEYTTIPFHLVYVDGGSPGYVRRYIETEARRRGFDLIRAGFYLSPNRARNMALKQVRTEYVVFLDNDVQVGPGWLENLLRCAEETGASVVSALTCQGTPADEIVHCADGDCHISVGGDGRRHLIEKIHLQGQRVSDVRSQLRRTETELAEFHCMLVRSQIFEQIGKLDEGLLNTKEYVDFCMTVAQSGGSVYFEPASVVTFPEALPLKWTDMPFYELRWSDAWLLTSMQHLREKWSLEEDTYFQRRYSMLTWRRDEWIVLPLSRKLAFGRESPRLVRFLKRLDKRLNAYITARYDRRQGSESWATPGELPKAIRYSLAKRGDGIEESIVSKTGETIRIVPDAMDGAVDAVNQQRGYALISGWASDGTHHGPANQVAVFVNSEAGPHAHTVVHRPDLVEGFKTKSLLKAGFEVILPGLVFERDPSPPVRVFAISATGVASELQYRPEYADGSRTLKLGRQ